MEILILLILATFQMPSVVYANADTGMGKCKHIDQHFDNRDGLCHRDSDGSPLYVLPVPKPIAFAPPQEKAEADSPEITDALSENSNIAQKYKSIYADPDYSYARYERREIEVVRKDLDAIQQEEDHAKFLEESKRLKEDYDTLDALDDTFRRNILI